MMKANYSIAPFLDELGNSCNYSRIIKSVIEDACASEGLATDSFELSLEEAKSFFIQLALDALGLSDESDTALCAWGLLAGYQHLAKAGMLSSRRRFYLVEREKFVSTPFGKKAFSEVSAETQKSRIDARLRVERLVYKEIDSFFIKRENHVDYIREASKKQINVIKNDPLNIHISYPVPYYKKATMKGGLYIEPLQNMSGVTLCQDDSCETNQQARKKRPIKFFNSIPPTLMQDDPVGEYMIGRCFPFKGSEGHCYRDAEYWCDSTISQVTAYAENDLGMLYNSGLGVGKTDFTKALQLFHSAFDGGCIAAAYNIGYMFFRGRGVDKDIRTAIEWFRIAARGDYVPALICLGDLFFFGEGVEHDDEKAFQYYKRAAELNDASSQLIVSKMYQCGRGVRTDKEKSYYWLKRSANQGFIDAQRLLGVEHYLGRGAEQNYEEAIKWLSLVYHRGRKYDSKEILIEIKNKHPEYENMIKSYLKYPPADMSDL